MARTPFQCVSNKIKFQVHLLHGSLKTYVFCVSFWREHANIQVTSESKDDDEKERVSVCVCVSACVRRRFKQRRVAEIELREKEKTMRTCERDSNLEWLKRKEGKA